MVYRGSIVGEYIADMVVEDVVIVENKAVEQVPPYYVAQVINYLKATRLPVGLLLNFGTPRLFHRRLELKTRDAEPEGESDEGVLPS